MPTRVQAAESYELVTADLPTNGEYVLVSDNGYVVTTFQGSPNWIYTSSMDDSSGYITDPTAEMLWTLKIEGDQAQLIDSNGVEVAPLGGNNNGIKEGSYHWRIEKNDDGSFSFYGQAEDPVILAINKSSGNKIRAYKKGTVTKSSYPKNFKLYAKADSVEAGSKLTELKGDIVLYLDGEKKALSTEAAGNKLAGKDVTIENEILTKAPAETVFTVEEKEAGQYYLKNDGKYLTSGPIGNSLSMDETASDYSLWSLEEQDGNQVLKNVNAKYEGDKDQYLEWFRGLFTTYGYNSKYANAYALTIFAAPKDIVEEETTDPGTEPSTPKSLIGDIVLYLPSQKKAVSTTANGSRLEGQAITLENGEVTEAPAETIFTVEEKEAGQYYLKNDGKYLTSGSTGSSLTMEATPSEYSLWSLEEMDGNQVLKNVNAKYDGDKDQYLEWFRGLFTTYGYNSKYVDAYALEIYPAPKAELEDPSAPKSLNGDIVLYLPSQKKAVSTTANGTRLEGQAITLENGEVTEAPAETIFTVEEKEAGQYYLKSDGKYLTSGSTGNSLTMEASPSEFSLWSLEEMDGNQVLKNVNAKYDGDKDQYLEWYKVVFTVYSYNSNFASAYALEIYPAPKTVTDPVDDLVVEGLEVISEPISGTNVIKDQVIALKAAEGAEIYFTMTTDGSDPVNPRKKAEEKYTEEIKITETPSQHPIKMKAMAVIPASGTKKEEVGKVYTFTFRAPMKPGSFGFYFGQLHSHTNMSDGAGEVENAFAYASTAEQIDFLAITDHSNWFEGRDNLPATGTTHLGSADAEKVNAKWRRGKEAARAITAKVDDFLGIYAFEMTWSGGSPGHMNTFNTPGFENKNADEFSGSSSEALQNYYNRLKTQPQSISQFNHPGKTFGDFLDFAFYDAEIDQLITIIEIGNGEGRVGGSGYFPSYEYYTRALDKGWHVAPTNNQDNHQGKWGDANTARTVALMNGLSEEALFEAMRNYRIYATEDNDLEILYTLNDQLMGSILPEQDKVAISLDIKDQTDAANATAEIIVNGGKVLASKEYSGNEAKVEFTDLANNYSYYYIRITQADGDIAVTAPVWVGKSINAGIKDTQANTTLPIAKDTLIMSSNIYNNSHDLMEVLSISYTKEGEEEAFHTVEGKELDNEGQFASKTSGDYSFETSFDNAGNFNINVAMKVLLGGQEQVFTDVAKISVTDPRIVTKILVDGSHYNDYVTGYYAGNMSDFVNLGGKHDMQVRITQPGEKITEDTLKDVKLFVIPAPMNYESTYTPGAKASVFEDEFVDLVRKYVEAGGQVIVTGLADYQDSNTGLPHTSYAQTSKLLQGIGSSMIIRDDELIDQEKNGGQPYRLFFDKFNFNSQDSMVLGALAGLENQDSSAEEALNYSSYSGASVDPGKGEAIVFGHPSTYSINSKDPAQGHNVPKTSATAAHTPDQMVVQKGKVVALATEAVGQGRVYAAGTVFLSNFESKHANFVIAENILMSVKKAPTISTIQEAREGSEGQVFVVEATVANGTKESGNAFFDSIYIQDERGMGINVFPVDDSTIARGDRVRIVGSIGYYKGEKQLNVLHLEKLNETKNVVINERSTDYASNKDNFGELVQVKGKVTKFTTNSTDGKIENIYIKDESGKEARLFIDGYIDYSDLSSEKLENIIKEGAEISAIGFISHDENGLRLRVRDRSEITLSENEVPVDPENPADPEKPVDPEEPVKPVEPKPGLPIYEKDDNVSGFITAPIYVRPSKGSSDYLGILSKGTYVSGKVDGAWLKIDYRGQTAYIAKKYVSGVLSNDGVEKEEWVEGYTKFNVFIRKDPWTKDTLDIFDQGTYVKGKKLGAWVEFEYKGQKAYVAYWTLGQDQHITGYLTHYIYLRPEKNSSDYITILTRGKKMTGVLDGAWLRVNYKGKTAYLAKAYLQKDPLLLEGDLSSSLFVRPVKNSSSKLGILSKGSHVKGIVEGAWLRIQYQDQTAYIAQKYVK